MEDWQAMIRLFSEPRPRREHPGRPLRPAGILPALLLIPILAASASAQAPLTAGEMLTTGVRNLHQALSELLPGARDAMSTLSAIRQLNETRRMAQRAVALDFPLDDLAGIVLVDRYDEAYVSAVDSLAAHFLATNPPPTSPETLAAFRDRLGEIPPTSDTPAAFVVAYLLGRFTAAGSEPAGTTDPAARDQAALVAVRLIRDLTRGYLLTRTGDALAKSEDAWHLSVIERVRCPRHRCGYQVREERNGLRPDGSLYRRYVVGCDKGGEERKLDFDLGAMGALLQTGGRQNLRKPIGPPTTRLPGVEP